MPNSSTSQADKARKAATPWRGRSLPVKPTPSLNATKQRKAFKKLSDFELQTGMRVEEFDAEMAVQRERVRQRFGQAA